MAGYGAECSKSVQNSVSENINPARLPLMLQFKPGIKAIQGTKLEMETLGNYTICYQAVVQDKVSLLETDIVVSIRSQSQFYLGKE